METQNSFNLSIAKAFSKKIENKAIENLEHQWDSVRLSNFSGKDFGDMKVSEIYNMQVLEEYYWFIQEKAARCIDLVDVELGTQESIEHILTWEKTQKIHNTVAQIEA